MYTPELLTPYVERYKNAPLQGMRVTAVLVDRVIAMQPITLDGLLAWTVVHEAEGTARDKIPFAKRTDFAFIPVPLKLLWKDETGGPLWCASFFEPDVVLGTDVEYFHKRAPDGHRTKSKNPEAFGVRGITGRWADRRTPFPVVLTRQMEALAIGDIEEVRRLLLPVTHVGKKTAEGFGAVKEWRVEPEDISVVDCLVRDGKLLRNVPVGAGLIKTDEPPEVLGWAPPYWNPAFYGEGWRFGATGTPSMGGECSSS